GSHQRIGRVPQARRRRRSHLFRRYIQHGAVPATARPAGRSGDVVAALPRARRQLGLGSARPARAEILRDPARGLLRSAVAPRAKTARKPTSKAKLTEYARKRDFSITPEPRPSVSVRPAGGFVVQKHAARRLHYDLRLELDGV